MLVGTTKANVEIEFLFLLTKVCKFARQVLKVKKFGFSLQKVLDFREFEKKQAEAELAKAAGEETRIQNGIDLIAQTRMQTIHEADTMTSIIDLHNVQNYFALLEQQKERLCEELAKAKIVADEKREVMREAMRKCKVLENLRDHRKDDWKKAQIKIEDDNTDDIVTSRAFFK